MYKTIVRFVDLQDKNHVYNVGDVFPREGMVVSEYRLEELATKKNRRKIELIKKVEDEPKAEVKAEAEVAVDEPAEIAEQPEKKPAEKKPKSPSGRKQKK